MSATGYAILSFGVIEVATVSPTRRGALVNWLITTARRPIYAWTTDEEIERHWSESRGRHADHDCVEVIIVPVPAEKKRQSESPQIICGQKGGLP